MFVDHLVNVKSDHGFGGSEWRQPDADLPITASVVRAAKYPMQVNLPDAYSVIFSPLNVRLFAVHYSRLSFIPLHFSCLQIVAQRTLLVFSHMYKS